jgi:hypothetical protein
VSIAIAAGNPTVLRHRPGAGRQVARRASPILRKKPNRSTVFLATRSYIISGSENNRNLDRRQRK